MLFEERINIKFCLKFGKSVAITLECLSIIYGGEALKKTAVVCD